MCMVCQLLGGCGDNPRAVSLLARADSLMNSRPDSALAVLEGAEGQMAGESKAVRMRYQLQRHQETVKVQLPYMGFVLLLSVRTPLLLIPMIRPISPSLLPISTNSR